MAKKKRFGLSGQISRGLTEVVNMAENKDSTFRDSSVPLSRIQLDPENPRKLAIGEDDLHTELSKADPEYPKKTEEFEKLQELAASIKKSGLIHPIIVYKLNDVYRVVAGERRTLACKLLGKTEIEARVFNEKPSEQALRLVQWFENNSREDLSLKERLSNLRQLLETDNNQNEPAKYSVEILQEMTGLSKSIAYDYLALLEAPADVKEKIEAGKIVGMKKAVFAAGVKDSVKRRSVIEACEKGSSLKELKAVLANGVQSKPVVNGSKGRGRVASRVNLGATKSIKAVNVVVAAVTNLPKYEHLKNEFTDMSLHSFEDATKAFKKLLDILEKEEA